MIFGVMLIGVVLFLIPTIALEMKGNPAIARMGIDQSLGSMEGKEIRLGSAASAYWGITTTVTSNGSVNAMHDSFTSLSGMFMMLGMMINAFFGGVGVGFLNFYIFIIIAVFISGLMVGRTPEFLGKKIEAREMKIAMIIFLIHPLLILSGTALASHLYANNPHALASWLNNPGDPGFSEMLYEFTSSSANNGSGFEGLGDTPSCVLECVLRTGDAVVAVLTYHRPCCYCRIACKEKIYTRKFRHAQSRYSHIWYDGICCYSYSCSIVILHCIGRWAYCRIF